MCKAGFDRYVLGCCRKQQEESFICRDRPILTKHSRKTIIDKKKAIKMS